MSNNIEITITTDELNRELFEFYVHENHGEIEFGLDYYAIQERKTHRSKFNAVKHWDRIMRRDNNIEPPWSKIEQLNMPEIVKGKISNSIQYVRGNDVQKF